MNAPAFITAIEGSALGEWMRGTLLAMPWVNAIHVLCVTLVFGTILLVDLRLLGLMDRGRSLRLMAGETLYLTWIAFAGALVTGVLYFTANATTYWFNWPFRIKMIAILLAGVNMALFQLITWRGVASWDRDASPPTAARLAGALSLLLWVTVLVLGRVIGFTKGYDVPVSEDIDFDFS